MNNSGLECHPLQMSTTHHIHNRGYITHTLGYKTGLGRNTTQLHPVDPKIQYHHSMDYNKLEERHPQIIVAESLYGTKRQNIFSTDINPKDVHLPLTSFATRLQLEH